ncbi:hypothetical protein WJX77_004078 [Trebouxia sp. C0004]
MPVAASPTSNRHDQPLTNSSLSRERQVRGTPPRQSKLGRESVVIQSVKQSYGLEQIVLAVSGAVEGLRDQLEALTILDETALTWPGLSLVLEDLEALVQLLSARACDAEEAAAQLQQDVTAAHAAADRSSNDQLASSKQADSSKKEAANAKRELTVVKAELASAKAESGKHKQRCDDLQSQNAAMTSDLKHSQQSLSSTQVKLQVVERTCTEQAWQISTLREELNGSVAELDQVEARLHDKDAVLASLQQAAQVAQKQQAQDRDSIFAGEALRGQLEGQVSSLSRQVGELQEQAAGHAAEVRKLYDWRDVMKTVHNERLQELSNRHQQERDGLLAGISQREVSVERLKSELASSHEQMDSQTEQLDSLKSSFTQQTAELHKAQSSVNQLQNQVRFSLHAQISGNMSAQAIG